MSWVTDFGPFGAMFGQDTPLDMTYLPLLGPMKAARVVAHFREGVAHHGDGLDALLGEMLAERNWRPQLVAVTAMLARGSTDDPAALWSALDRQSWVSPQIAAVASRLDGGFVAEARRRLTSFCGPEGRRRLPRSALARRWFETPVAVTDADDLACILAALCGREAAAGPWLPEILAHPDMVEAICGDGLGHRRGNIALGWRDAMDDLLA